MKRCSTSLFIRDMQIKATMRYHFIPTGMVVIIIDNNSCGWGCGKIGTITQCRWESKIMQPVWKTVWVTIWPSNSAPSYTPKRITNICPHTQNVYISIIHKSQKVEITCLSPDGWIKKCGIYPYNGLLLNHKKECTVTCYNMDEPWKHAKWKKPDTKIHLLYDSIYMKYPV